jgi:transporter family protein
VAPIDKLSIVFVIVLSVLFLGESLTWKAMLGSVLVVSGAILLAI